MKHILLTIFILYGLIELKAQSAADVLRLSDQTLVGTARAAGTNSNMNGIGADFTVLSSNPAGIAQFRLPEVMISPTFQNSQVSSLLSGNAGNKTIDEQRNRFRIQNFGLIAAQRSNKNENINIGFGLGLNGFRGANRDFVVQGESAGSIAERFAALAQGYSSDNLDPFEGNLAYETVLLINQRPDGSYSYDYENYKDVSLDKYQVVTASNRYNEFVISGGANINNKFLAGATIGIPNFRYTESRNYQEKDIRDEVPFFDNLLFKEYKSQKGIGVNLKLGAMYKPVNSIILGAAFHTPSLISVTDNFNTELTYTFTEDNQQTTNTALSPEGTIKYTVTTPLKILGSVGTIISKYGFINAEVEYQDNSRGKIKIDSDNLFDKEIQNELNSDIKANYRSTFKLNVGGELALSKFRLRGGYGVAKSPFVNDDDFLPSLGLGAGYRGDKFYIDLGYRQWKSQQGYQPYFIAQTSQTLVDQKITDKALVVTVGFKLY